MGQLCRSPRADNYPEFSTSKAGAQLCQTASLEQKSEPDTPFAHLSPNVIAKIKEINFNPQQLKTITTHPILELQNGISYQGKLQNNQMSGLCRLAMPDGSYYQGTMMSNHLNGEGMLINPNGEYYIGSFKNNKAEGKGIYVGNDFIYEGEFKNNLYSGMGKLTKSEESFEGKFEKGKMKKGKLIRLQDGSIYEGEFQGNIENGFGKSTINNSTYEGIFKNGLLEGEGKVKQENGDEMICNFERGEIINIIRLSASDSKNISSQLSGKISSSSHKII